MRTNRLLWIPLAASLLQCEVTILFISKCIEAFIYTAQQAHLYYQRVPRMVSFSTTKFEEMGSSSFRFCSVTWSLPGGGGTKKLVKSAFSVPLSSASTRRALQGTRSGGQGVLSSLDCPEQPETPSTLTAVTFRSHLQSCLSPVFIPPQTGGQTAAGCPHSQASEGRKCLRSESFPHFIFLHLPGHLWAQPNFSASDV